MEGKQSNQNQQTSKSNSNDSNSSSDVNNGESRRLTTPLWRPNSDYLLQNAAFCLRGLSINGTANENNFRQNGPPVARPINNVGENSSIGGNQRMFLSSPPNGNNNNNNNIVGSRMASVEIEREVAERCDFVTNCAMTIQGCKELQRMLGGDDRGMKELIITKATADLPNLMVHEIGFRFAQAVFERCNEQEMSRILERVVIANHFAFVYICNHNYGREAAKSLIQNLKNEEQLVMVADVLTKNICSFTNSYYPQQLLHFFIQGCSDDSTKRFIFNAMARNCVRIATNRIGCTMLQRYICPMYIQSDSVSLLINNIVSNSLFLAEDYYGNYLVQHVIEVGGTNVRRSIVEQLRGRLSDLAMTKCGSNVVEKCLQRAHQNEFVKIHVELTDSVHLLAIAQHPSGNYVLQCALEEALSREMLDLYRNLVKRINVHASILQSHLYGRTVIFKIRKLNAKYTYLVREMRFSA